MFGASPGGGRDELPVPPSAVRPAGPVRHDGRSQALARPTHRLHADVVAAADRASPSPGRAGFAQLARYRHLTGGGRLRIGQAVLAEDGLLALSGMTPFRSGGT